jgi:hypothetical protein
MFWCRISELYWLDVQSYSQLNKYNTITWNLQVYAHNFFIKNNLKKYGRYFRQIYDL